MARLTDENVVLAREIIDRYPVPKSAVIPLCHLAQQQDGWLSLEAMGHIAELVGLDAAEVLGTASFYEMFKRHPVGRYLVNICTSISCFLMGADRLLEHAESSLGVRAGGTTADGQFTLEGYECQAACTEAPCLQVNYRYFYKVTPEDFDQLVADLRSGRFEGEIPDHGTLARVRQHLDPARRAGNADPKVKVQPVWVGNGGPALDDGGFTPPPLPPPPPKDAS
jgi:NADH-quinone oxidoreductase subunit E